MRSHGSIALETTDLALAKQPHPSGGPAFKKWKDACVRVHYDIWNISPDGYAEPYVIEYPPTREENRIATLPRPAIIHNNWRKEERRWICCCEERGLD